MRSISMLQKLHQLLARQNPRPAAESPAAASPAAHPVIDRQAQPWLWPDTQTATLADIYHCFRLLLGRNPHREEWAGHTAHAGQPLASVVGIYVASREYAQRGLAPPPDEAAPVLSEIEGVRLYSDLSDASVGAALRAGAYEPEVAAVFRRLLRPGMGVIDIGANLGLFTMLAASLVGPGGYVLAIEPNPRNMRLLEASRRLAGLTQVTPCQVAASHAPGLLVLHTAWSNGTTSAPGAALEALLAAKTVGCVAVETLVAPGQRIDLIKVDVEGFEYQALLGCAAIIARDRPVIVSELSPGQLSGIDAPGYLRWLLGHGYALSVIAPDGGLLAMPAGVEPIMAAYVARGIDHIDIVATPA